MFPYINSHFSEAINHAAEAWGICCMRYEIKDIQLPTKVREAMQMQVGMIAGHDQLIGRVGWIISPLHLSG